MANFDRVARTFPTNGKRVARIDVTLIAYNVSGQVFITDVMFQGGTLATLWYGHPAEIEWSFNA
ncbi:hypothetical protein [Weizmannia phage Youna2]